LQTPDSGAGGGGAVRAPWAKPAGIAFFDHAGYPLAYRETGKGEPLILIHGSMSDYRSWMLQIPAFSAKYRTIALSLRHSYPEAWNGKGAYSVGLHADDTAAFIRGMGLKSAHIVGHSRGGAVAMVLALRYPDLVKSLILAEPAGLEGLLPDTPEGKRMAAESAAQFAKLARDVAAGDMVKAAREFVDSLGGPGAWEKRMPEARQVLLDNIGTGPACAERPYFTRDEIAGIKSPTLLLTGERSPPRYRASMTDMQACNKAKILPLVTIPGAAHSMQRDNPDAFDAEVLKFLAAQGRG